MASSSEEFKTDGSFSSTAGTSNENMSMPTDASSDSRCPICLERIQNASYLNPCFHGFCFVCIQEWSERKAECPLCKQHFYSFFHSIKADNDFEEYVLPVENRSSVIFEVRSASTQRPESPLDDGILHDGFSGPLTRVRERAIDELVRRFAIRRTSHPGGISLGKVREQLTIKFRRALYRSGVRVRSVPSGGFYRNISADFFHQNPGSLRRLVPWLKRELRVLCGSHVSLVNDIQHIILHNMTYYDLESQAFADILQPHLLYYTNHFLHEFINFARSPFNSKVYDWRASYDIPFPLHEEVYQSYSSLTTSSDEEEGSEELEQEEEEESHCHTTADESTASNDEEPSDDEVPGSSWSSVEQAVDDSVFTLGSSEELARRDNFQRWFRRDTHSDEDNNCSSFKNSIISTIAERMASYFVESLPSFLDMKHEEEVKHLQSVREACFSSSHVCECSAASSGSLSGNERPDIPFQYPQSHLESGETPNPQNIQSQAEEMGNSKQIQPKEEETFPSEMSQSKAVGTDNNEQLLSHQEEITNNQQLPPTEYLPSTSSKKRDSWCFPCIRRS
ncbi:E3 ubiquitin-protein ligase Topors [Alligator mississippiensis]|uniref:E3 ubiquitin-protein ligase Topors n=1 Tax=Alligator mississippiensis TaxID=8496 RepID=UPI0003D0C9F8|nr:E3 ubiquitin-protein ligase Topors [Alligator mississippiensis]XP_059580583.1 E3 ubiquitin-protein ligase Topors [Alligator mississippiensis]XP_059580584.1 E3 ubiquitin-protein ligase Topors [Alligator mississippiensis]XP_059580585.1 E3 ubiquitin-protein ligase Topors [Alligator mississippiensis]XP_059580586.1 E3 ubiquitin-protein ligase Topors [Alligator mississippiensis]XP_059580588.1 E3 ubiquitin-protein ligase Topors [Alligator mississippiensis]XP_059580589.1 E3 ubiquitin-protein ligas